MGEMMAVQVSTSQLKKLFDESPEVYVKLTSMACEKVAEELAQKIARRQNDEIAGIVRKHLTSKPTMTELSADAKKMIYAAISDQLKAVVSDQTKGLAEQIETAVVNRLVLKLDRHHNDFMSRVDKWAEEFTRKSKADVKTMAREEFLSVLAEVRAST